MIRIKRDSGYADRVRAYKIVLDGEVIGKIKNGQTVELDLQPGNHQLHMKIDWCRSNIVDFETNGSLIEFECGSNLRGMKLLLAIVYIIFLPSQYIWLKNLWNNQLSRRSSSNFCFFLFLHPPCPSSLLLLHLASTIIWPPSHSNPGLSQQVQNRFYDFETLLQVFNGKEFSPTGPLTVDQWVFESLTS